MKKIVVIICAVLSSGCGESGGTSEPDISTSETAATQQNDATPTDQPSKKNPKKAKANTRPKPAAPALYTHNVSKMVQSAYGGNCEFKGEFTNGGHVALTAIVIAYNVTSVTGRENRIIRKLSTAPEYGDTPLAPAETRPITLEARDSNCADIASLKLVAFLCEGEKTSINCTTDSLIVDNKLGVPLTR